MFLFPLVSLLLLVLCKDSMDESSTQHVSPPILNVETTCKRPITAAIEAGGLWGNFRSEDATAAKVYIPAYDVA